MLKSQNIIHLLTLILSAQKTLNIVHYDGLDFVSFVLFLSPFLRSFILTQLLFVSGSVVVVVVVTSIIKFTYGHQ